MTLYFNEHQRQWLYIAIASLLGVSLLLYKVYTSLIPMASDAIADKIPEHIYEAIGQSSLKSLDESELTPTLLSVERQTQLSQLHQQLLTHYELTDNPLYFRQWKQGGNAFALMDGSIVITDTLVHLLQNEAQLSAVLLHELCHVEHQHVLRSGIRASITYIALSLLLGDISVVSDLLRQSALWGVSNGYSREFELQADACAAEKLMQYYGQADALIAALMALENDHQTEHSWLSTHPSIAKREAHIKRHLAQTEP